MAKAKILDQSLSPELRDLIENNIFARSSEAYARKVQEENTTDAQIAFEEGRAAFAVVKQNMKAKNASRSESTMGYISEIDKAIGRCNGERKLIDINYEFEAADFQKPTLWLFENFDGVSSYYKEHKEEFKQVLDEYTEKLKSAKQSLYNQYAQESIRKLQSGESMLDRRKTSSVDARVFDDEFVNSYMQQLETMMQEVNEYNDLAKERASLKDEQENMDSVTRFLPEKEARLKEIGSRLEQIENGDEKQRGMKNYPYNNPNVTTELISMYNKVKAKYNEAKNQQGRVNE